MDQQDQRVLRARREARRREQHQAQEIGRDGEQRVGRVHLLDGLRVVDDRAIRRRILYEDTKHIGRDLEIGVGRDAHLDSAHSGTGLHHVDRLRMALGRDEEDFLAWLAFEPVAHRHRFRRGSCLVEQRCVRDLETREVDDHRLEVEQRLEPSLRDLSLIRRVGRVPARVLEDVSLNDGWGDAV